MDRRADVGPAGDDVRLDDGTVVGYIGQLDEARIGGMNVAVELVCSPSRWRSCWYM